VELFRALANQAEVDDFVGFGTGSEKSGGVSEIRRSFGRSPPTEPGQYMLLNNNYAALIGELCAAKAAGRIFLVVTDGVQSNEDRNENSLMGRTAAAMKKWLEMGGCLEVRILTAPCKGKYFSEELRARGKPYTLMVAEPVRPFLLYAFIPSAELMDEWAGFLARERLKSLNWRATYRLPQPMRSDIPSATPVNCELNESESREKGLVPRTNRPYATLESMRLLGYPWSEQIHRAVISQKAISNTKGKTIKLIPVMIDCTEFSVKGAATLTIDKDRFFAFHPRLVTYAKNQPSKGDSPQNARTGGDWAVVDTKDLRFEAMTTVVIDGGQNPGTRGGGGKRLCLEYWVPWVAEKAGYCVFTMTPIDEPVDPVRFEEWSTNDDSTKEQMQRVYNLQTLMEQITKNEKRLNQPVGFVLRVEPESKKN